MMVSLGLLVMVGMAFAEGANDVSKVVATLTGSGLATCRRAVLFGTTCTGIGALAAIALAPNVAMTLTTGLVTPSASVNEPFAVAALVGATGWVLLASRAAVPVSSSHAIVGAVVILGAFVFGPSRVHWDALWWRVALPLLLSPVIAMPLTLGLHRLVRRLPEGRALTIPHWLAAGGASFARGVSDAPKIAALGALFYLGGGETWSSVPVAGLFGAVALGMTLGSLVAGSRVTETLATRITAIDPAGGLAANTATAFVLISASHLGLPTSITHVISSSIVGLGISRETRDVRWGTVARLALAWFVTLPASGLLASGSYVLIRSWS